MFGIGLGEILLVLLVTFLISPKDLPKVLRKIGQLFGLLSRVEEDLRDIRRGVEETIREAEVGAEERGSHGQSRPEPAEAPELQGEAAGAQGIEGQQAGQAEEGGSQEPTAGPSA